MDDRSIPAGQFEQLQGYVQFAIQKEQEAIDFYSEIAGRVKAKGLAAELREIAAMEVKHRERLKGIDLGTLTTVSVKRAPDMKIADNMVAMEPSPNMSWQDVLNIAMHRELDSIRLYSDLANWVDNPAARQLFENLAAEETKHKLFFERTWDEEILLEN